MAELLIIGLLVFVPLIVAPLVIAIVALVLTFKNAREISNLETGRTPDR